MYNGFLKAIDWVGNLLKGKEDNLIIVAAGVLGLILIYQIIMTLVIARFKKQNRCKCQVIAVRRGVVRVVAWLFALFAFLTADILLPIVFILLVYMLEVLFGLISRDGCQCCCCISPQPAAVQRPAAAQREEKEVIVEPKAVTLMSIVDDKPRQRVESVPLRAELPRDEMVPRMTVSVPKSTASTSMRLTSTGGGRSPAPRKSASGAQIRKTSEQRAAEKRNERITELGAKIERQRQQAERQTDTMVETHEHTPYAAQTREALVSAEETARHMDQVQQRMDAMRQTSTTREVTTSTKTSTKSTHELRREHESLRQQYETLQNKLVQMTSDSDQAPVIEESGHVRGEIEYRNDATGVVRTAKGEQIYKIPNRNNKYDESEVRAALQGLSGAMMELQKKIDASEE